MVVTAFGRTMSSSDSGMFMTANRPLPAGQGQLIVFCHGHGGGLGDDPAYQASDSMRLWARDGYKIYIPNMHGNMFGNSTAQTDIDNGIAYAQGAPLNAASGKIHLMGYSMGGGAALTWAKNNPTLVRSLTLFLPLNSYTDLHDTNRGGFLRSGHTTNGSPVITGLSQTSDLSYNMPVAGPGVPSIGTGAPFPAAISTIDSSSQVTMSTNATATGTNILAFAGFKDEMEARYSTGWVSTFAGNSSVQAYDPSQNYSAFASIASKIKIYYSTSDGLVTPASVIAFAQANPAISTESFDGPGHTTANMDITSTLNWLQRNS